MSMGWFFGFRLPLLDKLLSRKRSTFLAQARVNMGTPIPDPPFKEARRSAA